VIAPAPQAGLEPPQEVCLPAEEEAAEGAGSAVGSSTSEVSHPVHGTAPPAR
jgi:hypothetical protein